ncbi:hypothetical protein [Oceanirhabdus seepicola]|uniref:Uncharacterized protein n=1 Tax=Oceanirhabdus seepicola TaxID=2828781 RepID=A0A9J6NXZ5_9CLOT|nr:hypothetical protein [Oceanirhabdus seepicola]MCM1988932.1 hypothetical protein [Oceanirhabdus seepicola]
MKSKTKLIAMFLLIAFFMQTIVFAEIPKFTVVIGKRGYSLKQLHKGEGNSEIKKGVPIYIKNAKGKWIDIKSGKQVNKNTIPRITYFDEYGNKMVFEKHDGEIIKEACEKICFELFITKNTSGIGQVVSFVTTPEGYSEFFYVNYFEFVDKENKKLTQKFELGQDNFTYPEIKQKNVNINLYNVYNEKIATIEDVKIKEDEKIGISDRKIKGRKIVKDEGITVAFLKQKN